MLLQIYKGCCKFIKVAANFFLQIAANKPQKICTRTFCFLKMFCSSCGTECVSAAQFCHQCGHQIITVNTSKEGPSSVDTVKLLEEYFHRGYLYQAIVDLLEKLHGVRMHVIRTLKRRLNPFTSKGFPIDE